MGSETDPRVTALRAAVGRLGSELSAYQAPLADRGVAERQLAALRGVLAAGVPDVEALRDALLLIAGALGSVSALAPAVLQLRHAVELFGSPRHQVPAGRLTGPPAPRRWADRHGEVSTS